MFDKMRNIFSGSSVVFVLSHTMFYVCLTLLVLIGSLVLGNPWYTRSFALILISETYVIFICYVTNPMRHHIGVQIWATDTLHTLAYQVIPTLLNQRTQELEDLPLVPSKSLRSLCGGYPFRLPSPCYWSTKCRGRGRSLSCSASLSLSPHFGCCAANGECTCPPP